MRLTVLGKSPSWQDAGGACSGYLVEENGTRVLLEGPYGILTGAVRTRPRVTLIAGGIGIAPLRALLESLHAGPGELTLLYRVRRREELVFREELDRLAAHRGATVHYLVAIPVLWIVGLRLIFVPLAIRLYRRLT